MQHPDYDILFKSAIARYDFDQTYDVLEFLHLPSGFGNVCNIPSYELMAIDRFTPYNYLWAENYSDYVYGFCKTFNFSPDTAIFERNLLDINGNPILDGSDNLIVVPSFDYPQRYQSNENYFVELPTGKYRVTFLLYQGEQNGVVGSIKTINQVRYDITSNGEQIDLNRIINHAIEDANYEFNYNAFCANSIVISRSINGVWFDYQPSGLPPFLLYADIEEYFTDVADALADYLYQVHIDYFYQIDYSNGWMRYPVGLMPQQRYLQKIERGVTTESNNLVADGYTVLFDGFPSYLTDFCYLQRANNNKWGNGSIYEDLGILPNNTTFAFNPLIRYAQLHGLSYLQLFKRTGWHTTRNPDDVTTDFSNPNLAFYELVGTTLLDYPVIADVQAHPINADTDELYDTIESRFIGAYRAFPSGVGSVFGQDVLVDIATYNKSYQQVLLTPNYAINYWNHSGFYQYLKAINNRYLLLRDIADSDNYRFISGNFVYTTYDNHTVENVLQGFTSEVLTETEVGSLSDNISSTLEMWSESEWLELYETGNITDELYLIYLQGIKAIQENDDMVDSVRLKEIHACLGAGEFAYYPNPENPSEMLPFFMNIARKLDWFAKGYGVAFNPDGSVIATRQRVTVPYQDADGDGVANAIIPDGWIRGQFADNKGGNTSVNNGQLGGLDTEERMGIAYQNRCNKYKNLTDDDPLNDEFLRGDIILCENFLQLFESYLEDLDKGLNWQEMGSGFLPSADGNSHISFEGLGTLLAEVAYMLSSLSSNIQQTHGLALKNNAIVMELLKGLGLPIGVGTLPVFVGEVDEIGENIPMLTFPKLKEGNVSIHKRLMDILYNLSLLLGAIVKTEEPQEETGEE